MICYLLGISLMLLLISVCLALLPFIYLFVLLCSAVFFCLTDCF